MTTNKIRLFIASVAIGLFATLGTASAGTSLVGATIKLLHVTNDRDGGQPSSAVFVEVLRDTNVSVDLGHGYMVHVTPSDITVKFTGKSNWGSNHLFDGLVIDDIKWPDDSDRKVTAVSLVPCNAGARPEFSSHNVLVDFSGLSHCMKVDIETNRDKGRKK